MRLKFRNNFGVNYSISDDNQIINHKRTIFLNKVRWETDARQRPMSPLFDIFIRLLQDTNSLPEINEVCSVTVINESAVYGSIRTSRHSLIKQNHNVYHGIIREPIDRINGSSIVEFDHFENNSMIDENCLGTPGDNGPCRFYTTLESCIYVDGRESIIPDPLHYDEIDQIKGTDNEEYDYGKHIEMFRCGERPDTFVTTLGSLITPDTTVYKKNIIIQTLNKPYLGEFDGFAYNTTSSYLEDLAVDVEMLMERNGLTKISFILSGKDGFNVNKLETNYVQHDSVDKLICLSCVAELEEFNNVYSDIDHSIIVIANDPTTVNIKLVDKIKCDDNLRQNFMRPMLDDAINQIVMY